MDHLHFVSLFVIRLVSTWTGECCYVQASSDKFLRKNHVAISSRLYLFTSKEWTIDRRRFRLCSYSAIQNLLQRLQSLPIGKLAYSLKKLEILNHWCMVLLILQVLCQGMDKHATTFLRRKPETYYKLELRGPNYILFIGLRCVGTWDRWK
jgi:hypothetical protein